MSKIFTEKGGTRKFERLSRWNLLEYTVISRNNRYAEYADNYDSKANKLNITLLRFITKMLPLRRFAKLDKPIILEDLSPLSRYDEETKLFLEMNSDKSKIRLYRELIW